MAAAVALAARGLPESWETPPRFVDVTAKSGVDHTHNNGAFGAKWMLETMGPGVVVFDANGDARPDLFFVNGRSFEGKPGEASSQALYLNRGGWRFEEATREMGLDIAAYCLGAAAADVDNDGDSDLFLACLGQDRLLRNDGDRFVDVSREAGLSREYESGSGAAFLDADRDGFVDLFVTRYVRWTPETDLFCSLDGETKTYCTPEEYPGASPRYYHNRGTGADGAIAFEDLTRRAGIYQPGAKALGVTVLDIEGDGWPDLAVACDTERDLLYRNRKNGTFAEIGRLAGTATSESGEARGGMGIDAADYERSGRPGILVSNFANEMMGLYRNDGDGVFSDVATRSPLGLATRSSLGWGTFFFDYDLDGWLDVLVVNGHLDAAVEKASPPARYAQPAQLFHNLGGGVFRDVTQTAGGDLAEPLVARGAAYGDLDGDGDLDVVLATNGGAVKLFENRGDHGSWLQVALVGVRSNRQGIGAAVEVTAGGATQTWLVRTGGSYLSQSQVEPVFGLGDARRVDRVVVRWPAGGVQELAGIDANRRVEIREEATETPAPD